MNLRRNLKHFMYKIATNNIFSVLISVAVIVWIFFHGKGEDILDLTLFFALVLFIHPAAGREDAFGCYQELDGR